MPGWPREGATLHCEGVALCREGGPLYREGGALHRESLALCRDGGALHRECGTLWLQRPCPGVGSHIYGLGTAGGEGRAHAGTLHGNVHTTAWTRRVPWTSAQGA